MSKKIVKFSSPGWDDFGFENVGIRGQTPGCSGEWGGYRFEINNDCNSCDYWVIYESVPKRESVQVPEGNTILVTSEEVLQRTYLPKYLAQFDRIVTSRADISGKQVIRTYYSNAWFVRRTYDQLKAETHIEKQRKISVVASNLVRREGQVQRFAFVNKLIGHFKDRIDVYGRGSNFVHDKYDAIAPYKFSIAIENESIHNYWTEKIADCYLCLTLPIYYGCPNISDFFDEDSYIYVDILDFDSSLKQIEEALETDLYEKRLPLLKEAKSKILDELQFFPYITRVLDGNGFNPDFSSKGKKTIHSSREFVQKADMNNKLHMAFLAVRDKINRTLNIRK